MPAPAEIRVVAPNLKHSISGVPSTIAALVPLMAPQGVVASGPGLPPDIPHLPLRQAALMPRDRWRVWHARRNTEMLFGLVLRLVLRRRYKLLFTSAAQRRHSGYTRWLIAQMDAVIATSQRAAGYLDREATVIHHGVDTRRFFPPGSKRDAKEKLGLPTEDLFIGCFGRVRENKGTDIFVDAAIALCKSDRRIRATILGRATEKHVAFQRALEQKIRNAGLHHRIRFMGEVPFEAVPDWYRALDLFIAPQRWEGFGLTPLEAMACGVPAVTTRVGAFEELLVPGETGAHVEIGDVAGLVATAQSILSDEDKLERWGRAAAVHAAETFPLEREAAQIMGVYDRLLSDQRTDTSGGEDPSRT